MKKEYSPLAEDGKRFLVDFTASQDKSKLCIYKKQKHKVTLHFKRQEVTVVQNLLHQFSISSPILAHNCINP